MTYDDSITSARKLREELRQAMIDLESMISSPARAPSWLTEVGRRTEALRSAILRHIEEVEGDDGIIVQIIEVAPHLSGNAEALRTDHDELTAMVEEVLEYVQSLTTPEPAGVAVLRDGVLKLLGALSRHRQRGVDLVYDAYDVDIGGTG